MFVYTFKHNIHQYAEIIEYNIKYLVNAPNKKLNETTRKTNKLMALQSVNLNDEENIFASFYCIITKTRALWYGPFFGSSCLSFYYVICYRVSTCHFNFICRHSCLFSY